MSLLDPLFYIKNISAGRKNNMNILKTSLKISLVENKTIIRF